MRIWQDAISGLDQSKSFGSGVIKALGRAWLHLSRHAPGCKAAPATRRFEGKGAACMREDNASRPIIVAEKPQRLQFSADLGKTAN